MAGDLVCGAKRLVALRDTEEVGQTETGDF